MANKKQYWLTLEEKNNEVEVNSKEFGTDLPVLNSLTETISTQKSGRRDFLKMLGFGVTAAAVAAACEMPVRKSIPYVVKPEEITPGIPNYYASAYTKGGSYNSVLVKTREGRPILLEGNKDSIISGGGVDTKSLGALLNLYDEGSRFKGPMKDKAATDWKTLDGEISAKLAAIAVSGKKIALLSSTIISPSTKRVVEKFSEVFTTTQWVQFDAISSDGILEANLESFGKRALPDYHFDKAELIVAVGADFIGTWISPTEFSSDYAKGRKVSAKKKTMSRHIQIESIPTLSGSNADVRIPVKPSEEDLAVVKLYNAIARKSGAASVSDKSSFEATKIEETATELLAAKGKSLVVSGSNNKATQLLVNAINNMLSNYGKTLSWDRATYYRQGNDTELKALLNEMKAGSVGALLVLDANPAYVLGTAFTDAVAKVDLTVDFSERKTETSDLVSYIAPNSHFLESWDDAMPKDGVYATIQPTISPLFNTRQAQQSLLTWAGNTTPYYDFIRETWKTTVLPSQNKYSGFEALWSNAVHDGEVSFKSTSVASFIGVNASAAGANVVKLASASASAMELKVYEKSQIGDGTVSDNPWMQELADPITRITWDDYFVANPTWVKDNGYWHNTKNREYKVIKAIVNGVAMTLPLVALPGVPAGVLGVAYGYGRTNTKNAEYERGENAFQLIDRSTISSAFFPVGEITVEGDHKIGIVQQEHGLTHVGLGGEKTRKIVKETTLTAWQANPASENDINFGTEWMDRKEWIAKYSNSLYGDETNDNPASKEYGGAHGGVLANGHHWGMAIDLNSCTGCGACVVACNVENNVPIVGRNEVRRAHDMNWLRIDKYHTGDENNPQVIFQPMMCQHCDNAPCENVCPVAATNHSTEGLNQMTYNRCIGTRYCANNCPYKVRRFNWYDYQGADSFSDNEGFALNNDFDANDKAISTSDKHLDLHNPITKMVLNPDVTVRGRGVIEKCSFCVQRIQVGKLEAKKDGRGLKDSDITTACQASCATNAISFGDTNNAKSEVSEMWADPRSFGVIEEIHTLPSVRYLTKVRNQKEGDLA